MHVVSMTIDSYEAAGELQLQYKYSALQVHQAVHISSASTLCPHLLEALAQLLLQHDTKTQFRASQ